ncbi:hypothetical protein GCM10010116_18110 [Microbispora rosea subsp. aerata]|nr:hypothetical protein GCM10010116_18110 [Microbispora rosea subsp. aerata]GIH55307.1 hypothetical protein Mro02_22210 [Microbispora rosea subsp. aerata]GLJ86596.1 hypothetical protein GCM10017588_53340 [Microbispora rosea subsp. aerata]
MTPASAKPLAMKVSFAASRSAPRVAAPRSEVRIVTGRSVSPLMRRRYPRAVDPGGPGPQMAFYLAQQVQTNRTSKAFRNYDRWNGTYLKGDQWLITYRPRWRRGNTHPTAIWLWNWSG